MEMLFGLFWGGIIVVSEEFEGSSEKGRIAKNGFFESDVGLESFIRRGQEVFEENADFSFLHGGEL